MKKTPTRFSREWWLSKTKQQPDTGCWTWAGFLCPQGYARTHKDGKGGVLVHRIAYEVAFGPFDPTLKVCHRCDVRSCVNPAHLFLGTQKDNLRDMFAKGRNTPRGPQKKPLKPNSRRRHLRVADSQSVSSGSSQRTA